MTEIRKYRPSNGTEGEIFMIYFCYRCKHDDPDRGLVCPIMTDTMWLGVDDAGYPVQWRYGENGKPKCTEFENVQTD